MTIRDKLICRTAYVSCALLIIRIGDARHDSFGSDWKTSARDVRGPTEELERLIIVRTKGE